MRFDLSKIFKEIDAFPVLKREPKKGIMRGAYCKEYPVKEKEISIDSEFLYPAYLYGTSRNEILDMLNILLKAGNREIKVGDWLIWLHAVKIDSISRVAGKPIGVQKILFIYRVKKIIKIEQPETAEQRLIEEEPDTALETHEEVKQNE